MKKIIFICAALCLLVMALVITTSYQENVPPEKHFNSEVERLDYCNQIKMSTLDCETYSADHSIREGEWFRR